MVKYHKGRLLKLTETNMKKQIIVSVSVLACSMMAFAGVALAVVILPPPPPPPTVPTSTGQCKKDGWRDFGNMFKNQGDCVSFVVTNGKNAPDGPPIN